MDESVSGFFTKNAADGYAAQYDKDHGPRLDAMIAKWNLRETLAGKRVVDVGGGLGFLGKRLDPTTDYWVIDGAELPNEMRVCEMTRHIADIDHDTFGDFYPRETIKQFDAAFCLETLEHCISPYNCVAEMKKLVKPDGDIFISIPHFNVTHNYIYPGLMADPNVFAQWLGQMALPIREYWLWDRGWNAHHFRCRNAGWHEKVMLFAKSEEKFRNATPVQMVNW